MNPTDIEIKKLIPGPFEDFLKLFAGGAYAGTPFERFAL